MHSITPSKTFGARSFTPTIFGTCLFLVSVAIPSLAQTPSKTPPPHSMTDTGDQNRLLADQIAELRAQIANLQAAQQGMPAKDPAMKPGMKMGAGKPMGMGMMGDKGKMGGMPSPAGAMKDDQGKMGGMAAMSGGAMPSSAPAPAMGMCCMGEMGSMSGGSKPPMAGMGGNAAPPAGAMAGMSNPASAMPAQPGASHLYHIGSTGFFLNHSQHITLTPDQTMTLNRIKEKTMLERASSQRHIDQGEQELYALTGADQPDNSKIQAKVAEIEKTRGDQRMNFIRAVSDASNVLTHEQHLALMGTMAANRK